MAEPSSSAVGPIAEHHSLEGAIASFRAVLTDAQRQELQRMERQHGVPDAGTVMRFTAELDFINRHKRRGKSPSTRLHVLLSAIGDFCSTMMDGKPCNVADTYVSSHPEIAALVWGSVKMTMTVLMNFMSYNDGAFNLLMKINELCPIVSEYRSLYPDSTRLRKSLSAFYAAIIRCCQHLVETIQRRGYAQFARKLTTSFDREFNPDLDEIRTCRERVKEAVSLAKAQADLQHQQLQKSERQKAEHSRTSMSQFFSQTEKSLQKLEEWQMQRSRLESANRRQQLLDSLSTHDFMRPFKQSNEKRYGNTTDWVFNTPQFKRWLEGESRVLWCSGKIGAGKTIVTCSVIQYILNTPGTHGSPVSFFFAQSDDTRSLNAHAILRSISYQRLSGSEFSDAMERSIQQTVSSSTSSDILDLLHELFPSNREYYVLIDGLDECDAKDRKQLLGMLSSLVSTRGNIRLFLSGRVSIQKEVRKIFTALEHLDLDCEATKGDIATYVKGFLEEQREDGGLNSRDPTLLSDIETALTEGAQGMFLWAYFQLQDICSLPCDKDIRNALSNLPRDLAETFQRALRRIESRKHGTEARRILPWVAASKRPLSLGELREAIAIEIGQQYTEPARLYNDMENVASWCENLVQVDEESRVVQFAHSAVRTFLLEEPSVDSLTSFHLVLEDTDHRLGEICVTYLDFNDFKTTIAKRRKPLIVDSSKVVSAVAKPGSKRASVLSKIFKPKSQPHNLECAEEFFSQDSKRTSTAFEAGHPFLQYASTYWIWHTTSFQETSSKTWRLWQSMVTNGHDLAKTPWAEALGINSMFSWAVEAEHRAVIRHLFPQLPQEDRESVLRDVARRDTIHLLDTLLCIPQTLEIAGPALVTASSCGHLRVIERLLEAGVDAGGPAVHGREALQAAAGGGHLAVVERLLAATVDVNAEPTYDNGRTALQAAAEGGHLAVVDRLRAAKADINAEPATNNGRTALQAAAKGGHLEVVDRLLAAQADVNAEPAPFYGRTALQAAAERGHLAVVGRLLAAKADINARPARHGGLTAFQAAEKGGHLEVVDMLLAASAKVNEKRVRFSVQKALQAAARGFYAMVVERLLLAGGWLFLVLGFCWRFLIKGPQERRSRGEREDAWLQLVLGDGWRFLVKEVEELVVESEKSERDRKARERKEREEKERKERERKGRKRRFFQLI